MATSATTVTDPVRLLRLLWSPPGPSPRSGLSLATIVEAAGRVAADDGVHALTMRRVAAAVGVAPMSLYAHVPGKAELLEVMLDTYAARLYADGDRPIAQPDRRAALRFVAVRNFDAALAHPWVLDLPIGRPVPGPGTTSKYEIELEALDGIGISDIAMDLTLSGLLGLAHTAARSQIDLARARRASGHSDAEWWQQVGPALATAMQGQRFPLAERVGTAASVAADAAADPRRGLDHNVSLLLAGLGLA